MRVRLCELEVRQCVSLFELIISIDISGMGVREPQTPSPASLIATV